MERIMVEYKKVKQEGEIAVWKVRITVMRKACPRSGGGLRWLDEEPTLCDDFLQ